MEVIHKQINEVRTTLDHLVETGADFDEIYRVSKAMDVLINQYYNQKNKK